MLIHVDSVSCRYGIIAVPRQPEAALCIGLGIDPGIAAKYSGSRVRGKDAAENLIDREGKQFKLLN